MQVIYSYSITAVLLSALLLTTFTHESLAEDKIVAAKTNTLFGQPRLMSLAINVANLEKSLRFYSDMMGMREYRRYPGNGQLEVTLTYGTAAAEAKQTDPAGAMLVITEKDAQKGAYELGNGFSRLAFGVPDVQASVDKISAAGYEMVRPPMEIADGKIKIAFVKDPDGYLVELIEASADY